MSHVIAEGISSAVRAQARACHGVLDGRPRALKKPEADRTDGAGTKDPLQLGPPDAAAFSARRSPRSSSWPRGSRLT